MCFMKKSKPTPAPAQAPAAPLPPPEEEDIGTARKEENHETFGQSKPSFRVNRDGPRSLQPDNAISM